MTCFCFQLCNHICTCSQASLGHDSTLDYREEEVDNKLNEMVALVDSLSANHSSQAARVTSWYNNHTEQITKLKQNINEIEEGLDAEDLEEEEGKVTFQDLADSNEILQSTRTTHTITLGTLLGALGLVLLVLTTCFCCACRRNFAEMRLMGRRIDDVVGQSRGGGSGEEEEGIPMRG